ncbi:hypothetical protein BDV93DRAFT_503547 [Ceratobasidium sp. AG-I]|nr:hypothetical protein BDV93DRAFT_503547 [Ceratobasidium sp. AG-I]
MVYALDESDVQGIKELLGIIYAPTPDDLVISSALESLKALIETKGTTTGSDDGNHGDEKGAQENNQEKIPALKQYILAAKPDLFKHLIDVPKGSGVEEDFLVLSGKAELIGEMLRDSPPCKLAFIPYINELLHYAFQVSPEDSATYNRGQYLLSHAIGELLCPDSEAEDAHRVALEALSDQVKMLSDYLPLDLSASAMTEDLVAKQKMLASGLESLAALPLKLDAVPAFVEAGGLDALLGVVARG